MAIRLCAKIASVSTKIASVNTKIASSVSGKGAMNKGQGRAGGDRVNGITCLVVNISRLPPGRSSFQDLSIKIGPWALPSVGGLFVGPSGPSLGFLWSPRKLDPTYGR